MNTESSSANPYIDLFKQLKHNIETSTLKENDKTIVKCAIIETFADVLAAQDKTNKEARIMLMDLLNHTIAPMELANKEETKADNN